jgi:SAM-dependent methyltransferase
MESYTYPDKNDKLTIQFIREKESDDNYWAKSENAIIDLINGSFNKHLDAGCEAFLDAGCGSGRLIPFFESHFSNIVALEPDPQRFSLARDFILSKGLDYKTQFVLSTLEDYAARANRQFDFILSSHVIQHIHSYSVLPMLESFAQLLKARGLLAITTCHSVKPANYFIKSSLKNGRTHEEKVNEEEFNSLIQCEGILPVQFFNSSQLMDFIISLGFRILQFRVFHIKKTDRLAHHQPDPDDYFNASPDRQKKYGRDMFILAQKVS